MLGAYSDLVIDAGMEGGNEVEREVIEGLDAGNVSKEVLVHKFLLGVPDFFSMFMENHVKVRILLSCLHTRWRSEEVREEGEVDIIDFIVGRRRLYSSGSNGGWIVERWGWAPNNIFGRWGAS